jgi:uncharacterized protein YlxW (UPF0749 family)
MTPSYSDFTDDTMQPKIIYALAFTALLVAFTAEAAFVYESRREARVERQAAVLADNLNGAQAEIGRLKATLETQATTYTEQLARAKTDIATQKALLQSQMAINAELVKAAVEFKARAHATAVKTPITRSAAAPPKQTLPSP